MREEFGLRLGTILTDFPRFEDMYPFYADLIYVLYDRDRLQNSSWTYKCHKELYREGFKGIYQAFKVCGYFIQM